MKMTEDSHKNASHDKGDDTKIAANVAPLSGLRVLDLTRLLPGPLCGQYFADLGAEVIKIEDTHAGDYVRPSLRALINRGKRCLSVNLKHPLGRDLFLNLIDTCDVLLESFRPGVMDRLGLGYAELLARKPTLVIGSISGFGQTGPRRLEAGHDINYQAITGILDQTGTADKPAIPGFLLADLSGTLSATTGILAALLRVKNGGRGGIVDVSMADTLLAMSALPIALVNEGLDPAERGKGTHTGGTAHYHVYETADGRHLAVGAQEPKFWKIFCETIGMPELISRHSHNPTENLDLITAVSARILTRRLDEWQEAFKDKDCCVSSVFTLAETLEDPHFLARGTIWKRGETHMVGLPFKLSNLPEPIQAHARSPVQGQDTRAILKELGLAQETVSRLFSESVVFAPPDHQ